jgi:predicted RNA-binding Zn-ribbon protein involved in translation (DUF1610 family)
MEASVKKNTKYACRNCGVGILKDGVEAMLDAGFELHHLECPDCGQKEIMLREDGKKKLWKDMTAEEREEFSDRFYELWEDAGFGDPDYDSPNPWGCPWYWNASKEVCSPEELFAECKDEIAELLAEEEAADAASEAFREELERMYREGASRILTEEEMRDLPDEDEEEEE